MKNYLISRFSDVYVKPCLVCLLIFPFIASAQSTDPGVLTLERIFSANEFSVAGFGPARWLEDGTGYTTLEASEQYPDSKEIIRYNPQSGNREILVTASLLIPEGNNTPLSISSYDWSADRTKLLIFTNTRRVWRYNTRGDYWVLDLETKKLSRLGGNAEPATLMFAKFSPDGSRVAYVTRHNIYVESLSDHVITPLTKDGSETLINGTFDWVYEEEFGLRDGFRWSPDGTAIAFWQLDAFGIRDFYMINNTDSLYPFTIPIQYPKVGTQNSACRVGTVPASGGNITWFNVPGDPRNNYIVGLEWATSSDEVILQHLNRKQNKNEVMIGNRETGAVKTIYTDTDEAWVEVVEDLRWMKNGQYFTWISEKDGWRHVYLISRDGKEVKLITDGDYDVISISQIDEKGGYLYFIASPQNATQRYLYRTRLNGKGKLERITPENEPGTHSYQVAADAKWAIHTYSTFETPPVISMVSLPKHTSEHMLVDNQQVKAKIEALDKKSAEFFKVDMGDGVVMDAWMIKPPDFDASKKYPVLFQVYGEPAGQTVLDHYGGSNYLWHLMLAQQGYVVMSMDNQGTPAPRGRDWRKIVYGQIGILAPSQQAKGVQVIAEKYNFVDEERIGVWGWSGGGSMTLDAMLQYPEIYKTGMSVAPVTNQLFYDNVYQERYMGLPWENKEGYKNGSPVTYAKNLKGNLLIVHGTGDDNVHYQNTEVLVNELIRHNKIFSMMSYPNRSHGIYEGENTSRHLREILTSYLKNNLPAGPKTK